MSRHYKRQNKRRNKAYRPRDPGCVKLKTVPWIIDSVFAPLYEIIDQLEKDGTIFITQTGIPVFLNIKDGKFYETVPAISGFIEGYEIHERRTNRDLDMTPLKHLVKRIEYGAPITELETKAARSALNRLRTETMGMTWNYADAMLRDFKIKEELSDKQHYIPMDGVLN